MAIEMPVVVGHPNRNAFRGVLTLVDVPSDGSLRGEWTPGGIDTASSRGGFPSLLGMALDSAPELDRHDARRKVGVITRAEIVGRQLEIGGYLFAKDFPEVVEEIAKSRRERGRVEPLRRRERSRESMPASGRRELAKPPEGVER